MSFNAFLTRFKSICSQPPWLIIRSNRLFTTGRKSLRNNGDLKIFTNSDQVELQKMIDGILLVIDGILTTWKSEVFCWSNILLMNFPLSIEISISGKVALMPLCSSFYFSSVRYISRKALPNSPPLFKVQRSSVNRKELWNRLPLSLFILIRFVKYLDS